MEIEAGSPIRSGMTTRDETGTFPAAVRELVVSIPQFLPPNRKVGKWENGNWTALAPVLQFLSFSISQFP